MDINIIAFIGVVLLFGGAGMFLDLWCKYKDCGFYYFLGWSGGSIAMATLLSGK